MIFQWLHDKEITFQDKLLLSLYDHGAFSPRQFCILSNWNISQFRVIVHRIRKKHNKGNWIQTASTRFYTDATYYRLGTEGLRYCGQILQERVWELQLKQTKAQHKHILGLNEILIRLVQHSVDTKKMVWLATREASDYLFRLCRLQKPKMTKQGMIRPDAYLLIGNLDCWIEYDAGTEGPFSIEEKMFRYVNTLKPLQENLTDQVARSPIVWVTKTKMRKRYLENIWRSLLALRYNNQEPIKMLFFVEGEETSFFYSLFPKSEGK